MLAARSRDKAYQVVAGAVLLNLVVGLRDLYVFRLTDAYAQNTWQRYSSVLFGLTLLYTILRKFNTVSMAVRTHASILEVRIAQKERELTKSYLQMEQLARVQERMLERTRILRDLHDGVGGHISSAIRQVESGNTDTNVRKV